MTLGLDHSRFIVDEEWVSYFRADRSTVIFGIYPTGPVVQLCQIVLHRTGWLFAQFPYFPNTKGVVSKVDISVRKDGSSVISPFANGKFSSHHVKYSHPLDGKAHFSQDRKHVTQFFSDSVPLATNEGHLFDLHCYGLGQFRQFVSSKKARDRLYLPFLSGDQILAVTVSVEWRLKSRLVSFAKARHRRLEPMDDVPRRMDGALLKAALLGQPASSALQDHLLVISIGPAPVPLNAVEPGMIFFGGWRHPFSRLDPGERTEALTFTYPPIGPPEKVRELPVSDFIPNAG